MPLVPYLTTTVSYLFLVSKPCEEWELIESMLVCHDLEQKCVLPQDPFLGEILFHALGIRESSAPGF